ncbi:unnamed protein product [Candida parapsilosis]
MITDEIKPIIQHNYDYFILAQSRIRTLHTFYILQVFRSSITGAPIMFPSTMMKSGSYCNNRELWWSPNASSWYSTVCKTNPPNWSIVELSNGTSVNELISYLHNPNPLTNIPMLIFSPYCLTFMSKLVLIYEQMILATSTGTYRKDPSITI